MLANETVPCMQATDDESIIISIYERHLPFKHKLLG